jgi:uncharacterized protein (DUF433 family)
MTEETGYPHIDLNENGVPRIDGTRLKVQHVAVLHTFHGLDGEQIRRQYPFLTLAQIYSALAYYHDHKEEIDRAIEEGEREAEALRAELEDSQLAARLRAIKEALDAMPDPDE